ncbi:DNA polymerase [Bacillus siamensis]|uniref:DNA polymerase n=1 Tax=Bacillus siamensis TaxID=659243 RepID=UPI00222EEEB9|nr:DNA polymerase [Bacillus siamensis]UZD72950.1 DNA polymerase [Bacillus siamensis]UZD73464.1 DNA polymerase [Bacillus siamensis]
MKTLSIDIETFSSVDLLKCGVYAYTEAPDFEILLFAYAFDEEPIKVIDLAQGEALPHDVLVALTSSKVIKTAYNANFERTCIAKHFNTMLPPTQWRCTAVHATTLGLPGNLDGVAKALKLSEQKDKEGKALIRYFSVPCKPTKANGQRVRNLPEHAPDKWEKFKAYCGQDVEVERSIKNRISKFEPLEAEQELWALDQDINDRGVRIDANLVKHAIACDEQYQAGLMAEAKELTGLPNPNSTAQLKKWLEDKGLSVSSLAKDKIEELIKNTDDESVHRVLRLRQEMAKTSVKKYLAMEKALCPDSRVRGLLQFYGASRTGRWAGRLVQVQNLPQNKIADLDTARTLLKGGHYEAIELLYGQVPFVLSQLVRTAFIPSEGNEFYVSDFSAIEARVIAWLAGEGWRLDVFNTHGKIYEASAAQMFKVPVESITKGSPLRQKGKVAELALGYQGGKGALIQMGALTMGLAEDELPGLVKAWRTANKKIVQFWYDVEAAAVKAVKERKPVKIQHGLTFLCESGILFVQLPSGRRLAYAKPKLEIDDRFGKEALTYEGKLESGKWGRLNTYGGKLVENIVQAVARDCLAVTLIRLDDAGYKTVMHVHDEAVLDVPRGKNELDKVEAIMGEPIPWAKGLPLTADGFITDYYKKD